MGKQTIQELNISRKEKRELKNICLKIVRQNKKRTKKILQAKKKNKQINIDLSRKINEIVNGKVTKINELGQKYENYFREEELQERQQIVYEKIKIQKFWQKVLNNTSYSGLFSSADQSLLQSIESLNIFQNDESAISLQIKIDGHHIIKSGTYKRTIFYNESNPIMLGGDKIHNNSKLKKGIFKFFFSNFRNAENSETLQILDEFVKLVCEEIIPFSLQYYLKKDEIVSMPCQEPQYYGEKRNIEATCPYRQ